MSAAPIRQPGRVFPVPLWAASLLLLALIRAVVWLG